MMPTQAFTVAPARRMAMLFNTVVYACAATWWGHAFWQGRGSVDGLLALVFCGLVIWTVAVRLRRNTVVSLGPQGVAVYGLLGVATHIPYDQLTAHTLQPERRTGILFWQTPDQAAESFAVISQRAMGAQATAAFREGLLVRRPDLPARLPHERAAA